MVYFVINSVVFSDIKKIELIWPVQNILEKLEEEEFFICWGTLSKYLLQIDSQLVRKFVAEFSGLSGVMQLQSKHRQPRYDALWQVHRQACMIIRELFNIWNRQALMVTLS